MNLPKINFLAFCPTFFWRLTSTLGYGLGHVWSTCCFPLKWLTSRITKSTEPKFSKSSPQAPLFPILNEKKFLLQQINYKHFTKSDTPISIPMTCVVLEEVPVVLEPPVPAEITEKRVKVPRTKFKRRNKKPQNLPLPLAVCVQNDASSASQSASGFPAKSEIQSAASVVEERLIIEAGGGGDCQLHSFLKGLELQYPELTKYQEDTQWIFYTAEGIRQLGIDFAKKQRETGGPYVEEVLGYADADRHEYNQSVLEEVEDNLQRELTQLNQTIKNKKNKLATYQKQVQATKEKYEKLKTQVKQEVFIQTEEEFLTRLAISGFCCSSLHLFALSVHFQLPIHVHEQGGIKNYDIQIFNPTESTVKPIHLYRVGNGHYQLIIYPESKKISHGTSE